MNRGSLADFEAVCHPAFFNHEAKDEPAECRNSYGPAAIYATSLWLRHAFSELRWEVHSVIAEGEHVVVHCTNSGRHVNTFVTYDLSPDGPGTRLRFEHAGFDLENPGQKLTYDVMSGGWSKIGVQLRDILATMPDE